jgi:signal transduction histidine kinase
MKILKLPESERLIPEQLACMTPAIKFKWKQYVPVVLLLLTITVSRASTIQTPFGSTSPLPNVSRLILLGDYSYHFIPFGQTLYSLDNKELSLFPGFVFEPQWKCLFILILVLTVIIICLLRDRIIIYRKVQDQQARLNEGLIISRDLHDNVGAQLSAAKMFLNDLRKYTVDNKAKILLDNSLGLLETSIRDLRSVMDEWRRSESEDRSYVSAVEELVGRVELKHNIHFSLSHHGLNKYLSPALALTLYRITQELIENTVKYAKAGNVIIDVVLQPGKLVFTYEDNGTGYDPDLIPHGHGLSGIESKVLSLDGFLEIDTSPGKGFMALLEIPMSSGVGE